MVKSDRSLVTFGKHVGMFFDDVRTKCPSYAAWVMTTVKENKETHSKLKSKAVEYSDRDYGSNAGQNMLFSSFLRKKS